MPSKKKKRQEDEDDETIQAAKKRKQEKQETIESLQKESERKLPNQGDAGDIGLIFSYGLYSIPAFDDVATAQKRPVIKGSEWYAARLVNKKNSASVETCEYHKKQFEKVSEYDDLVSSLKPKPNCVKEWLDLACLINAKYAILTVKHHDGFCLWPTSTTSSCLKDRDLVAEFKAACHYRKIKFGIAYSWGEFRHNNTKIYINKQMKPQVEELLEKYNPDIWHFDGDWFCHSQYAKKAMHSCLQKIQIKNPNVWMNDCTGESEQYEQKSEWLGSFATCRTMSGKGVHGVVPFQHVPWEYKLCLGSSWGYNQFQSSKDYLSFQKIKEIHQTIKKQNGRLLINVGIDGLSECNIFETNRLLDAFPSTVADLVAAVGDEKTNIIVVAPTVMPQVPVPKKKQWGCVIC